MKFVKLESTSFSGPPSGPYSKRLKIRALFFAHCKFHFKTVGFTKDVSFKALLKTFCCLFVEKTNYKKVIATLKF